MWLYARGVLMADGHDPREIEEYPWDAIELYLSVRPYLEPFNTPNRK